MSYAAKITTSFGPALLILCGLASGAVAQGTSSGGGGQQSGQSTTNGQMTQNGGQGGSGSMSIRQGIQNSLQQAGYSDVSITPSSFYVHAKDKQGHPVAMIVGPDSITEVTELPGGGTSPGGAGAGSGGSAAPNKGSTGGAP